MARAPVEYVTVALMVHRVEKEFQRYFEYVGHLEWIGVQIERRLHPSDNRRHPESGQDIVVGQASDDLDPLPAQPGLFLGFAQCRGDTVGIAFINASAGEADLPGMV